MEIRFGRCNDAKALEILPSLKWALERMTGVRVRRERRCGRGHVTTEAVVGALGPQVQGRLEAPDAEAGGSLAQGLWRQRLAHTLISDFQPEVGGNPFIVCGHSGPRTLAQPRTSAR